MSTHSDDIINLLTDISNSVRACAKALEARVPREREHSSEPKVLTSVRVTIESGEKRYSKDAEGRIRYVFYPARRALPDGKGTVFCSLAVRQAADDPELLADRFAEGDILSVNGRIQSKSYEGKVFVTFWADEIKQIPPSQHTHTVPDTSEYDDIPF